MLKLSNIKNLPKKKLITAFGLFGILFLSFGILYALIFSVLYLTNVLYRQRKEKYVSGNYFKNNK